MALTSNRLDEAVRRFPTGRERGWAHSLFNLAFQAHAYYGVSQVNDLHAQFLDEARARMQALGWTHRDLADRLRISRPRVTELLSRQHSPSLRSIERVAKALGCVATLKLLDKQ